MSVSANRGTLPACCVSLLCTKIEDVRDRVDRMQMLAVRFAVNRKAVAGLELAQSGGSAHAGFGFMKATDADMFIQQNVDDCGSIARQGPVFLRRLGFAEPRLAFADANY